MQAMTGGEGQLLDQLGAAPVAPGVGGDGGAVHDHPEPAQQVELAGLDHPRTLARGPVSEKGPPRSSTIGRNQCRLEERLGTAPP